MTVPNSALTLQTGHPLHPPPRHATDSHGVPSAKSGSTADPFPSYVYCVPPYGPYRNASDGTAQTHPQLVVLLESSLSSYPNCDSIAIDVSPRSMIAPGLFGLLQVHPCCGRQQQPLDCAAATIPLMDTSRRRPRRPPCRPTPIAPRRATAEADASGTPSRSWH